MLFCCYYKTIHQLVCTDEQQDKETCMQICFQISRVIVFIKIIVSRKWALTVPVCLCQRSRCSTAVEGQGELFVLQVWLTRVKWL